MGAADAITDARPDAGIGPAPSSFSACALAFPYQDEPGWALWLGGDSAYSTLLTPNTALWSFQDTFVGKIGQKVRQGAGFIANSLALVSCNAGVLSIDYVWGLGKMATRHL